MNITGYSFQNMKNCKYLGAHVIDRLTQGKGAWGPKLMVRRLIVGRRQLSHCHCSVSC